MLAVGADIMRPVEPQQAKKTLRKQMRAQRDATTQEQRTAWSDAICANLVRLPTYQSATVVHCFLSIQTEIDTRPIIEHALAHGKRVVTPIFVKNSAETPCCEIDTLDDDAYDIGGFGLHIPRVMRPVDIALIDFVVVPLLATARIGGEPGWRRLGYGAGFYDHFLARTTAPKIGIAFSFQYVADLPREPHDVLLDQIVDET